MKRVLCAGYFGCSNLGDDAILLGFIEACRGEGIEVATLSGAPEETYRLYGIRAVPRKDMAAIRAALSEHDALVFPGGSIFQDVTSTRSPIYYANLVREAKKLGKPVVMLGQGVGPITKFLGKRATKFAFENARGIAVRDPESARLLSALGVSGTPRAAADLALLLPPPRSDDDSGFQVGQMRAVGLIPRPHGKGDDVEKLFAELSRLLFENGYMPTLIEMDRELDGPLIQRIEKAQGGKIPSLRRISTPMDLQRRLARMDAVISMRLHGGILATTVGVLPLLLSYDPKVKAFAQEAGLPAALPMNPISAGRVYEVFQSMIKDREALTAKMLSRRAALQEQAKVNVEVLRASLR